MGILDAPSLSRNQADARYARADIVSGSVRCHIPTIISTVAAGVVAFCHRSADFSVVQCDNPVTEFWNGYAQPSVGVASETTSGAAITVRYAILTNVSGSGANQTGATVWPATFYQMLLDADFRSAGGTVSADGTTITVPDGIRFRNDPMPGLRLTALGKYFHQVEILYQAGSNRFSGDNGSSTLGDLRWLASGTSGSPVYSADWSVNYGTGGTPSSITGSTYTPLAVLGTGSGSSRARLVAVEGDSIGQGDADTGGTYGERGAIKRALLAAGYSWISVAIPGTCMNDMKTRGGWRVRASLLKHAQAVVTDHGHNDRSQLIGTHAAVVLPVLQWHNGWLRAFARPGAKVVRATLMPHTNSTDSWATLVNQTYKTTAADPTNATQGWQITHEDYVMRTGSYASLAAGSSDPRNHDGGFNLRLAIGASATDLKWPVTGTANYATSDGTHPSTLMHSNAAAVISPLLPGLIGF